MALMNVFTCISSSFSSFYLQVVKSRGCSPQCGGLSLMGWGGEELLLLHLVVPPAVAVTLPRIW